MDTLSEVRWDSTFKKSISTNSQLQFSKFMTLSTYDKGNILQKYLILFLENEEPVSDQVKFSNFIRHVDSDIVSMYCVVDRRNHIFSCLKDNKHTQILSVSYIKSIM